MGNWVLSRVFEGYVALIWNILFNKLIIYSKYNSYHWETIIHQAFNIDYFVKSCKIGIVFTCEKYGFNYYEQNR